MSNSYTYRKIYEGNFGPIPTDEFGRTYEIHHRDGNRANNIPENLACISIQEHYDIHYSQGDYGACVMIAKRMQLPLDHLSEIQKGCKRPGIGGRKKGCISWSKGKKLGPANLSIEGKQKKLEALKRRSKIKDYDAELIREDYENRIAVPDMELCGKNMRNGKKMSYERLFANEYSRRYGVSSNYIYQIIKGISKIV